MPEPTYDQLRAAAAEVASEHESTLRVLHHVVTTYERWRDEWLPNELSDNAISIARQRLAECEWEAPAPGRTPEPVSCADGSLVHDFKGHDRCPACGWGGIELALGEPT